MRWVEFLTLVLEAQAETLNRLAAYFGEEELLEVLENIEVESANETLPLIESLQLEQPKLPESSQPYQELEGCVQEFHLSPVLEFHLWAYPFYRILIESPHELNQRIPTYQPFQKNDLGTLLVDEAMNQAERWIKSLPFPSPYHQQAEKIAWNPWIRFRATALKRIGKRPFGPVY